MQCARRLISEGPDDEGRYEEKRDAHDNQNPENQVKRFLPCIEHGYFLGTISSSLCPPTTLSVPPFYIKENPNPAAQDWGSVREVVCVYWGVKFCW